jgi:hypothetical protein
MRKLFVAFLLPLFLLFAQQGALTHELTHLRAAAGGSSQSTEATKQVAAETLCLSCLSHADLPGLVQADEFRLRLAGFVHAQPGTPPGVASAARALAPRSRGPPTFL